MAWRTVVLTNEAHICLRRDQLYVERAEGAVSIPVEDIAIVLLENRAITLTSALLSRLCEVGAAIFVCDRCHLPNGLMMPFHAHSRVSQIANLQVQWGKPFKKRMWQRIIQHKIANQAFHLAKYDPKAAKPLKAIVNQVDSGDPKNREAYAARLYWSALMDSGFVRGGNDYTNAALNYGYTVVRACVARAVVSAGLLPCFGVHHNNDLNGFNLADDIIEPFRPFVDQVVMDMRKDREGDALLSKEDRAVLATLPARQVKIKEEVQTILNAAEVCTESFVRALREKNVKELVLPEFAL